jgi:hypothetical protein
LDNLFSAAEIFWLTELYNLLAVSNCHAELSVESAFHSLNVFFMPLLRCAELGPPISQVEYRIHILQIMKESEVFYGKKQRIE